MKRQTFETKKQPYTQATDQRVYAHGPFSHIVKNHHGARKQGRARGLGNQLLLLLLLLLAVGLFCLLAVTHKRHVALHPADNTVRGFTPPSTFVFSRETVKISAIALLLTPRLCLLSNRQHTKKNDKGRRIYWMTSTRKSKISVLRMAAWISSFWSVRRLFFSEKHHDLSTISIRRQNLVVKYRTEDIRSILSMLFVGRKFTGTQPPHKNATFDLGLSTISSGETRSRARFLIADNSQSQKKPHTPPPAPPSGEEGLEAYGGLDEGVHTVEGTPTRTDRRGYKNPTSKARTGDSTWTPAATQERGRG